MHLRPIDPITAAVTSIRNVEDDIQMSGIGRFQASDTIAAIDGGASQLSSGDSLYQSIGQLLLRLDVLTKVVDVVSEVSVIIARCTCAALIQLRYTHFSA